MMKYPLSLRQAKRLQDMAVARGMSFDRAFRAVFRAGMATLERRSAGAVPLPSGVEAPSQEPMTIDDFLRRYWLEMSDEQLAEKIGCGPVDIADMRRELGLRRKPGRALLLPRRVPVVPPAVAITPPLVPDRPPDGLDDLIRAHWRTKNDWDIGRMMDPVLSGVTVRKRRLALGLKVKAGKGRKADAAGNLTVLESVDNADFELMVTQRGYTMEDYMVLRGLQCTRERVRQVAEQRGLKHSVEDRAPEWALWRKARQLGRESLMDREWLTAQFAAHPSVNALAAALGIGLVVLRPFISRFGLTATSKGNAQGRKRVAGTVDLVCANPACGKSFKRLKRLDHELRARSKTGKFYCSSTCVGKGGRQNLHAKPTDSGT